MHPYYFQKYTGYFVSVIYDNTELYKEGKVENYLGYMYLEDENHIELRPQDLKKSKWVSVILDTNFIRSIWVYKENDSFRESYINQIRKFDKKNISKIPKFDSELDNLIK